MTCGALAATLLALAPLPASTGGGDELRGHEIVAIVDGREIDAERFGRFVLAEKERTSAGADALEQLLQERLVDHEARRRGVLVTEADVSARQRQIEEGLRQQSQGRLGLAEHLAGLKIDRTEFRTLLRKSIACERMMAADFALPAGALVPAEKQSLWFQELKARASIRTRDLPAGVAAEFDDERITRTEWALKIYKGLPAADAEKLFDDFVAVELLLEEGRERGLEVTPQLVAREIEERSRLLREKLAAEGLASEGLDYLGTLKARGEDPDAVVSSERFRAEVLLKELARLRHGEDGFRGFYEERRADFDRAFGRRVRVATLFLKAAQQKSAKVPRTWPEASAELEQLQRRAESGGAPLPESFASLAKLRSEHASAARGGDLGFLSQAGLERHGLPASLLDAAAGSLQGPIVTADGVHLLLVSETRAASPFEEIAGEVEKAARRELLRELRARKKVERRI